MAVLHFVNAGTRLFAVTYRTVSLKTVRYKHIGQITDVKFGTVKNSIFIKPLRMTYIESRKNKKRDIIDIRQYVLTLTYNISRKVFVFVKHFRPGLYHTYIPAELRNKPIDMQKYPKELGIVLEYGAGIVNKDKPIIQVAKEEILDECGYDVPLKNFQIIHNYTVNVGISGTIASVCYCEVTDDMKRAGFNNVDIVEMNMEEFDKYISKPVSSCVLIGYYWFKFNKCGQMKNK